MKLSGSMAYFPLVEVKFLNSCRRYLLNLSGNVYYSRRNLVQKVQKLCTHNAMLLLQKKISIKLARS
jgi:hypothetical protein